MSTPGLLQFVQSQIQHLFWNSIMSVKKLVRKLTSVFMRAMAVGKTWNVNTALTIPKEITFLLSSLCNTFVLSNQCWSHSVISVKRICEDLIFIIKILVVKDMAMEWKAWIIMTWNNSPLSIWYLVGLEGHVGSELEWLTVRAYPYHTRPKFSL